MYATTRQVTIQITHLVKTIKTYSRSIYSKSFCCLSRIELKLPIVYL